MKDIIAISALSFVLISMGALYSMGFLKFAPNPIEAEIVTESEKVSIAKTQLEALEAQKINMEREKAKILSLQNDLEMEKRIIVEMRNELQDYLSRIETAYGKLDESDQEKITRLAKLYDSMKAESAAPIAAALKLDLLEKIITNMKDKKAAKLMAALPPSISAEISRRMGKNTTI
ncbi:MAG: hypothetical protein JW814_10310 [Candidatus Krumholzibacteriota bacterium]|nr:hypothetical protein [Candidatus Krumholzibacteriota bacterium]